MRFQVFPRQEVVVRSSGADVEPPFFPGNQSARSPAGPQYTTFHGRFEIANREAMDVDWGVVGVLAVIFFATTIRSAFGFGEALIAVPLLALLIPVEVAVPLAVLVSITVAAVIIVQDWQHVHFASAWRLVISTLFGIPFGLWLLTAVAEPVVKAVLAVVIVAFSIFCLIGRSRVELKDERLAWVFGFFAGILGGAYGMNGPPLVIYGALRHWSPERLRA